MFKQEPGIHYVYNGSRPCTDCKFFYHSMWRAMAGKNPKCIRTMEWYGEERRTPQAQKLTPQYMRNCAFERGKDGFLDSCSYKGVYWVPKYKKDLFKLLGDVHEF